MSSPIPSSDPNLSAFIAEVSLALIRGGDISVVLDHCAAILVRHLEVAFARIWILNQEEQVLLWSDTGYRFVKRQAQTNANVWVSLGDNRPTNYVAGTR